MGCQSPSPQPLTQDKVTTLLAREMGQKDWIPGPVNKDTPALTELEPSAHTESSGGVALDELLHQKCSPPHSTARGDLMGFSQLCDLGQIKESLQGFSLIK